MDQRAWGCAVTDINKVRERLAAISCVAGARVSAEADDIAALLDDHARLQASHDETVKAMRQAVVAFAYAQQNDPIYLQPYGLLDAAIKQAKAVKP